MKTRQIIYTTLIFIFSINLLSAQELNNNELAKKVLQESFNVQPGNVIVISGGQHTLDLMEAFVIEARKLGAVVNTSIDTDKMIKSLYRDVPEKFYGIDNQYWLDWLKLIDIWISLPGVENYEAVYKNVPQEKFAKMNKSQQVFYDAFNTFKVKGGYLAYPTKSMASVNKLDFEVFKKMQWKAINADYEKIAQNAKKLEKLLKSSKKVQITTVKGTNLSFSVNGRECFISDGVVDKTDEKSEMFNQRWVTFPDGKIYMTAIENSGNGKVFIPKSTCNYEPLQNISFKVKDGKLINFKVEKGEECFLKRWNQYSGPKDMIGEFQIGLNPEVKVMEENAEYRPGIAEGMVYVSFGDNSISGGKNKVNGNFSSWFPITNATVKIDGKVVVKDGKLMLD